MTDTRPGPADTTGTAIPAVDEPGHQQAAAQIRRQHPDWVTIWVARKGQYFAYPLFRAPRGTALAAQTPAELTVQMTQIEQAAGRHQGKSPDTGADS